MALFQQFAALEWPDVIRCQSATKMPATSNFITRCSNDAQVARIKSVAPVLFPSRPTHVFRFPAGPLTLQLYRAIECSCSKHRRFQAGCRARTGTSELKRVSNVRPAQQERGYMYRRRR